MSSKTVGSPAKSEKDEKDPPAQASAPTREGSSRFVERFGIIGIFIVLLLVFSVLRPDTFATIVNGKIILETQVILVILALGAMVPLIAGQFDLSVGFVLGFSAMTAATLSGQHVEPVAIIVISIAAGSAIGLLNGILVSVVGVNAFIATLGSGTLVSGLTIWMSNGELVYQDISQRLLDVGRTNLFGLQLPVYYMLVTIAVAYFVLTYRPFGRYLYALGGGAESARLAGLPVRRLSISVFVISGTIAGVAGVLQTALSGSASSSVGPDFLMPAFAACFLGSTTILPGRFNVLGTVISVYLLATGIAGLQQLGAPFWLPNVFYGGVLLIAVSVAVLRGRIRLPRRRV
jgi:ribose transport system permease protein